jgi:hypothetical protein
MHEFRAYLGCRYLGIVMADNYEQAVDRTRVIFKVGPYARVRVARVDEI